MAAAEGPERCVLCRRDPVHPAWRPFCSERCRNLDLARWVDGTYRVPGEPADDTDERPDREPEDPDRPDEG